MLTVAVANFKGGTGKTVTACNAACEMAASGMSTLVVDADPQHNATDFFQREPGHEGPTIADVLMGTAPEPEKTLLPTQYLRVRLLPADTSLLSLDLSAVLDGGAQYVHNLDDWLALIPTELRPDLCVIDCPPSFTAASVAAYMAADLVVIPTRVDAFSVAGVRELIRQLRQVDGISGRPWRRCKVLLTMADRTSLFRQGAELFRAGDIPAYKTVIRSTVVVGESTYARQPLSQYAPGSTAAQDYADFGEELFADLWPDRED